MVKKSMATSIAVDTTLVILLSVALLPGVLWAQQASGIAGVVRDATGAVLPGVTVEAASPALIEKVRTSVTDGEGQYKIIDLRPGTYAITFGLPGFSSVKREGIELSAGFTATVNAEMRVGAVEETVTVSGSSPLVDVQNVRQQKVLSDELLDALPSGSKAWRCSSTSRQVSAGWPMSAALEVFTNPALSMRRSAARQTSTKRRLTA